MQIIQRYRPAGIIFIACIILFAFTWHNAYASERSTRLYRASEKPTIGGSYFVEFRARHGLTKIDHTYVVYGRLDAQGKVVASQVVGFSDGDEHGVHLFSAHGSVGSLKEDLTDSPIAIYRRQVTAVQFQELHAKIRQIRRAQPPYHMLFFNCMDFAGEIAESIGLNRPPSLMSPKAYVVWLRAMNGP